MKGKIHLSIDANKLLGDAVEPLKKLALLSESSIKDIKEGKNQSTA